ncbi:hypothetical protein CCR94_02255 [Rhodoblastus sphagnicola]|uniref:Uncharacterized protein n=1 Tax=Rhodoblastus sphagnicola TaxID=333368 RepID=A0A2S6NF88_9HYPH|nr:hypothetical protein [Rhodoblastus sphagnicola]MBB4200207.1 hypothetical protein [Rhodoblastus sphagnicola]PPQ33244.1 hypothetical protein CCR94_02255 [Rhodoblastus sphagnicola]
MIGTDPSFMAGYIAGESDARSTKIMSNIALAFTGQDVVEITRRDLDELYARLNEAEATAANNFRSGRDWRTLAKNLEQDVATLKSRLHEMSSVTRERDALLKFLDIGGHLLHTHRVGKADRPEFAELRDFALDIAYKHLKGEFFEGLGDQPKKLAWFKRLWNALR